MLDNKTSRLYYLESELVMLPRIQNHVKDLRQRRGWTQQQLAEAVGVSRQSINSIECNRYVPSLPLALSFARVFGRPTDEIFTLEIHRGDSEPARG
jgi:putative transcriptional regulator